MLARGEALRATMLDALDDCQPRIAAKRCVSLERASCGEREHRALQFERNESSCTCKTSSS
jgi:hypothetical protein